MNTTTTTTTTAAAKKSSTLYMVELAMMIAIILLMSFTPLGYLRTPGLSITLLTIPVAVGAIILGPKGGAVCGLAFGATSFYMAVTGSSAFAAALFNINPFGTFIVCIVARVLEGWITGLIFAALYKSPAKKFSYYVASLACPLLNTFFFMGFLCLFFYNTAPMMFYTLVVNIIQAFQSFGQIKILTEAGFCFVVGSIVSKALSVALKRA